MPPTNSPAGADDVCEGQDGRERGARQGRPQVTDGLTHGREPVESVAQVSLNRIGHDDGVVDHDAERHHETRHAHLVNGQVDPLHARQGEGHGEGQGEGHHEGGAPAQGQEQHHQNDAKTHEHVVDQSAEAFVRVPLLIEQEIQRQVGRQDFGEIVCSILDLCAPVADALFRQHADADHDGLPLVHQGDFRRRFPAAAANLGQVPQAEGPAVRLIQDHRVAEAGEAVQFPGYFEQPLAIAGAQLAGRDLGVPGPDGGADIGEGQAGAGRRHGIEYDLDFFDRLPVGPDQVRPRYGAQALGELFGVTPEHVDVGRTGALPFESDQPGVGVAPVVVQAAGQGAGGQVGLRVPDLVPGFGPDPGRVGDRILQFDAHHRDARLGRRRNFLDFRQFAERVFERLGHQRLDPFRRRPGIGRQNRGHAVHDPGIFRGGQGGEGGRAGDQDQGGKERQQPRVFKGPREHDPTSSPVRRARPGREPPGAGHR